MDVRPRDDAPFPQLEVRNPMRQTRYRVLLPAWPSKESAMCVCTDFARRGLGTCKHLEAAWNWLSEHPFAPPVRSDREQRTLWEEIERAPAGGAARHDLRRRGAVLYTGSDA